MTRDEIFFETRSELREWLTKNHSRDVGVWAIYYKKNSKLSDLSWDAIVEECLCFGWIDSLPGKVDETKTKHYISPRKANSGWSKRNKLLLVELKKKGLLTKPGIDAVTRAKQNGSWERFDLSENMVIPPALKKSFTSDKPFLAAWKTLSASRQRGFLQQIYDAKTSETLTKRISAIRSSICE